MMADLIRTSMFCDVDDGPCIDYVIPRNKEQPTNENTYDVTFKYLGKDIASRHECVPTNVKETFHQTCARDTEPSSVQRASCNGTSPSLDTCMDFWTRIMLSSKVDISTFYNVSPCAVFGNDYLHSIVTEASVQQAKHCLTNDKWSDKRLKAEEKKRETRKPVCDLPYTHTAIVIAAIYTSGRKSLSRSDIMNRVSVMFPEYTPMIPQTLRKALYKNIRNNKHIVKQEDDTYRIVPGKVYMSTFCRKTLKTEDSQRNMVDKYSSLIHHHLGVPNMLDDIGFEVVTTSKHNKKVCAGSVPDRKTDVKDGTRDYSVFKKRKCEVDDKPNKRPCLTMKLPVKPCFHDDSSNHEGDELLKLNDLPAQDSSHNSSQETPCTQQSGQEFAAFTLYPTQLIPAVVSPIQNIFTTDHHQFYIPFVGSVPYVDVLLNGQIVQVPFHNMV